MRRSLTLSNSRIIDTTHEHRDLASEIIYRGGLRICNPYFQSLHMVFFDF